MFDLDAYLEKISIKEVTPSDTLVSTTVEKCGEVIKTKEKEQKLFKQIKRAALIAAPACALLLIGILIGAQLFGATPASTQPVSACFTVDINPSVCVNVDENSIVISLAAQNDDAEELIKKLDCVGLSAEEAIYKIVEQAKLDGYLNDINKYVLIGCFGVSNENETLGSLQNKLEQEFGDIVNLLIVSGSLDDKSQADSLAVSAGLLKLSRMAEGVQLNDGDKVEDVVDELNKTYCAPMLSVREKPDGLQLSWSKLNFEEIGYSGEVTLNVVAADSVAELESGNPIKTYSFKAGEAQTAGCKLTPENSGISSGTVKYYGIQIKYGSKITLVSNAVSAKMPVISEATPTPKPSSSATIKPTTPPAQTETPQPSTEPAVSGSVSGSAVVIKWRKETSDNLSGYKVVASKTNPNPKYPDDGYIKFITNKDTTSTKLYDGDGGLKGGQTYYFSVTYLYNDGSTKTGNAVQLTVPKKTDSPTEDPPKPSEPTVPPAPTDPPSGDYPSAGIGGSMDGTTARLSWCKINDSRLEGYKVVCSFTDSTPSYPDNGYVYWITNGSTSCSVDMTKRSGYAPGATAYFAITTVYNDGTKRTGSVLSLTMPTDATPPPPPADYPSTSLSASMDGTTARLNWSSISDPRFEGYKVVMSYTDSSPSYPKNGYVYWITDGRSSCSIDCSGGTPGANVYFAITALFNSHSVSRTSNTVTLTIPVPPPPPPADPPAAPPASESSTA